MLKIFVYMNETLTNLLFFSNFANLSLFHFQALSLSSQAATLTIA